MLNLVRYKFAERSTQLGSAMLAATGAQLAAAPPQDLITGVIYLIQAIVALVEIFRTEQRRPD